MKEPVWNSVSDCVHQYMQDVKKLPHPRLEGAKNTVHVTMAFQPPAPGCYRLGALAGVWELAAKFGGGMAASKIGPHAGRAFDVHRTFVFAKASEAEKFRKAVAAKRKGRDKVTVKTTKGKVTR